MAVNTRSRPYLNSSLDIDNKSFDGEFDVAVTEPLGYDGVALQRGLADNLATKVTVVGSVTYVGLAAPGTSQATAKWQALKIDEGVGAVSTYADGNANFDNVATDLTSLSYS